MNPSPLTIASETGIIPVHSDPLEELTYRIYAGENIDPAQKTDLIFCSSQTIRRLNRISRSKDNVTDVLSYPFNDADFLGEIYICTDTAQNQAEEYGLTMEEEVSRLLAHGMIHLLGYDHLTEPERCIMEDIERKYLAFDQH
ncbi:MAG: rRNA maturation RNase YbeY [Fibrobacterota bacterium]